MNHREFITAAIFGAALLAASQVRAGGLTPGTSDPIVTPPARVVIEDCDILAKKRGGRWTRYWASHCNDRPGKSFSRPIPQNGGGSGAEPQPGLPDGDTPVKCEPNRDRNDRPKAGKAKGGKSGTGDKARDRSRDRGKPDRNGKRK